MAGVTGLEPAASGVTGRRSNRLSYTPAERRNQAPHQRLDDVSQTDRRVKRNRLMSARNCLDSADQLPRKPNLEITRDKMEANRSD